MRIRRAYVVALAAVLLATAVAVYSAGLLGTPTVATGGSLHPLASSSADPAATPVSAVHPRRDANFRVSNQQTATVEPFYQASLRARVSGEVKFVAKDIGEPVRAGELLVEIDVPDLRQAVAHKDAVVEQREKELAVARADLAVARSAVDAAAVAVRVKDLEVSRARDLRAARKTELDAVAALFNQNSVVKSRVDAALLDYQAADRAVEAAGVDVEKAKVEQAGKSASLEKAQADVDLKRVLVEVARKDRDAAVIQHGYARLYAPFDGVITARSTDPGKFVFGTAGASEPLAAVARVDLITVAMKLPDNAAAYVSPDTEAFVEFEQLPGVTVRGRVTRFSPVIDPVDRSMRVEVDVVNGTRAAYTRLLNRTAAESTLTALLPFDHYAAVLAAGAGQIRAKVDHKGWHEGEALIPDWGDSSSSRAGRIVPGMNATIRLDLEKFADAHLLPASAVFSKGGRTYIMVVEDGTTKTVPVAVQVNDGRLVKVARIVTGTGRPVTHELTGREVVLTARQLEVGDGQRVDPVIEDWK